MNAFNRRRGISMFAFFIVWLLLCFTLSGCAVCERHPDACAFAGAVVVGVVVAEGAALASHSGHNVQIRTNPGPPPAPVNPPCTGCDL